MNPTLNYIGVIGTGAGTGTALNKRVGIGTVGIGIGSNEAMGVLGISSGTSTNYGTSGVAVGTHINYGIYGYADGGSTNYGVYGTAGTGSTDYAGYFKGAIFVDGVTRMSNSNPQAIFKYGTATDNNGIWVASYITNIHYNWKISAQDDYPGGFQVTPSTGIGSTSWASTSWSLRYDGTHLKQYTPVSNYNGNEYLVNLELLAVSPICVAAAGGAYTNIIKTSGTQTCNTACGTTSYTTCTDVVIFNDIGNVNQLRLKNNWGCATSDSYIKYCCCK